MPPPPPSNPPTGAPPPSSDRPRPSRRVSDLVSHFESTSAPRPSLAPTASSLSSGTGRRATSFLPRSHADPPTTSRVQQHVRRFSADPATASFVNVPSRKASAGTSNTASTAPSPAVVTGNLDEMDWTPRRTAPLPPRPSSPPVSAPSSSSSPPIAPSSPPRLPPAAAQPAAKTGVAAAVFVPAVVSSSGAEGKTKMAVKAAAAAERAEPEPAHASAGGQELCVPKTRPSEEVEATVPAPAPSSSPPVALPLASPPLSPLDRLETRRPSIAFVDAVPPTRPARAEHRSSSAPTPPSPTKPSARPSPLRAKTADSLSPSSAAASKPKSKRPPLTRASTAARTSFSAPTAPSSRFTVPPTPSAAYSTSASSGSSGATRAIPAWALFARDADPLVLPDLDRVLEELGGQADLTGMPDEVGEEDRRRDQKGRRGEKGRDEEWELESLREKKGEKGDEERLEDAHDAFDGVFGSSLEREAWEDWLRGPPPSRWARLKAFLLRRSPSSLAAAAAAARKQRSLIFPPFHLLPSSLTVTDLKANRHAPPPLVSFQALVLKAANGLLGAAGSSYGLKLTSLEGLRDLMQMVTLLVTAGSPTLTPLTAGSTDAETASAPASSHPTLFRTLFVTVPSFLSLDFVAAFGQALVFLLVLTVLTLGALYELYRFTGGWHGPSGKLGRGKLDLGEGYDREDLRERKKSWRDSYGWKVAVTFWCSSFYLPLSKLAISALVWGSDYWPSPSSSTASLGAASEVCYRTSATSGAWNWAYVVLPIAVVLLALLSLWMPWRLWQVVKREAPRVDGFTDLGERRRDKNGEYERLLDADPSPFNYLYREYRRPWASFRSLYLLFKLANVLLVVLISTDNCAFRTFSDTYLSVVRQGCLLALLAMFFALSAWTSPYLDRTSNSSDVVSRFGYSILAMLGLLEALGMGGTEGAVITTNVVVYGLNIYFALIGTNIAQRVVKHLQRRLDFSVDIFSPRIDLSKHLSRRVWQESIAALFLCSPDFAMPEKQKLTFTKDDALPPYLLGFQGTVAERFVENIKILREIGLDAYSDAVSYRDLSPSSRIMQLRRLVQERFAGPDAFYHPPDLDLPVTSFFGRLDVVPFPFVAVFRYDQQPTSPLYLVDIDDLERLVEQNEAPAVAGRCKVRLALRSLEGQLVYAPHVQVRNLGVESGGHRTEVERHIHFTFARLRIDRNSSFLWRGMNCSSGFDVKLEYGDGVGPDRDGRPTKHQQLVLPGSDFGIFDDFSLNQPLATLFRRNRLIIDKRLPDVEAKLQEHRDFFRLEAEKKHRTLSHSFLLSVFAEDRLSTVELDYLLRVTEHDSKVRTMARRYKALFERLEQRMDAVKANDVRGWWYLVWDDLFRRNADVLKKKPEDFSPHYRSSICYNPMTRSALEAFLHQRGFTTSRPSFFHPGFLNQLYFYLDEQIFGTTSRAIPIHLGAPPSSARVPYSDLARLLSHDHRPSISVSAPGDDYPTTRKVSNGTFLSRFTAETGSGTQEDEDAIRQRPAFLFEEAFSRPTPPFRSGSRWAWLRFQLGERARESAMKWLGLRRVVADWRPSEDEGMWVELRKGKGGGWEVPRDAKRVEEEKECAV
ncbi:hypothetical protein JCM6882_004910 [Rhodosporidiobolus microsporus]